MSSLVSAADRKPSVPICTRVPSRFNSTKLSVLSVASMCTYPPVISTDPLSSNKSALIFNPSADWLISETTLSRETLLVIPSALTCIAAASCPSFSVALLTSAVIFSAVWVILLDSVPSALVARLTSAVMLLAFWVIRDDNPSVVFFTSARISDAVCVICDCKPFSTSTIVDFVSSIDRSRVLFFPLSCRILLCTPLTLLVRYSSPSASRLSLIACMPFSVRFKMYDSINLYRVCSRTASPTSKQGFPRQSAVNGRYVTPVIFARTLFAILVSSSVPLPYSKKFPSITYALFPLPTITPMSFSFSRI